MRRTFLALALLATTTLACTAPPPDGADDEGDESAAAVTAMSPKRRAVVSLTELLNAQRGNPAWRSDTVAAAKALETPLAEKCAAVAIAPAASPQEADALGGVGRFCDATKDMIDLLDPTPSASSPDLRRLLMLKEQALALGVLANVNAFVDGFTSGVLLMRASR